jgi:hypothetical protein
MAVACVAGGVLIGVELQSLYNKVDERDTKLAKVQREHADTLAKTVESLSSLKNVQSELAEAQANVARLTTERDEARAKLSTAAPAAPADKPKDAPTENKAADFAKGLSEMFKGEEGKKMLRTQSEFGARMVYGDWIKGLDPATSDAVMSLLTDRQTALATVGMEALSSGDQLATAAKSKEVKDEYDKKLKAMVGDAKMSELEGYERTAGDRMMFAQVESQFATSGAPLSAEQRNGVLSLMQQERLKLPPSAFERGNDNPAEAMKAMQDEKAVAAWIAREEQLDAAVVAKSNQVLSPDQVSILEKSLKQMSEMKKFGMKMWQSQQKK